MSFFPDSYFGANGAMLETPSEELINPVPLCDSACLEWAKTVISDLGLFGWVRYGRTFKSPGAGDFPVAWIYPIGFREDDQVDPYEMVRILTYGVYVGVKEDANDEDIKLTHTLDFLSNAVANVHTGSGPPGCITGMSRVEQGKYDVIPIGSRDKPVPDGPTAGVYLIGNVAYTISGRASRLTNYLF